NRSLDVHEKSVLRKGLSFCPTRTKTNELELLNDFRKFERAIKLREHFHGKQNGNEDSSSHLSLVRQLIHKGDSRFVPAASGSAVTNFINAVRNDVKALLFDQDRSFKSNNMSMAERRALQRLKNDHDIVIKPADKSGKIVI